MLNRDIVRLSAIVIGLTAGLAHAGRNRESPLGVCNVLSHLSEYRGKMVQLRGALRGGYHGQVIVDVPGSQVCSQLERTGHHWPAAIAITQWQEGYDVEDGPAPFESNVEEIRRALADAKKRVRENSILEIVAVFEGELRSRKDAMIWRTTEGWYVGYGYGQGGQYPALLVLKTVRDVKAVPRERR
ncbi:MAG TPA: hypothetical protein VN610_09285 [Bryobacteraceae bacterium]|nr:hypothetical protein [Bryobacteraceae bacterium]